jgi:hypothetical protein
MYQPTKINGYMISDIFHTDTNKFGFITGLNTPLRQSENIRFIINGNNVELIKFECSNSRSITFTTFEEMDFVESIDLVVVNEGVEHIKQNLKVNKYPILDGKLIMSIMVKDEDNYIRQWIDYHSNLGIDHFLIYNNSENYLNLEIILSDHINTGKVSILNWYFDYLYDGQIPTENMRVQIKQIQENHTLINFQKTKLIGFFDPDEYLNPQVDELDLNKIFDMSLQQYSRSIEKIGGFKVLCKNFSVFNGEDESGYEFLNIGTSQPNVVTTGDYKHFVNPRTVKTFSNHDIIIGSPALILSENLCFFNHYRFLNKKDRDPWHKGVANRNRTRESLGAVVSIDLSILKNFSKMTDLKKITNKTMEKITFVMTSCERPDLLAKSFASFMEFNTYPIEKFFIIDDSGKDKINDFIKEQYSDLDIETIYNIPKIGHLASIDKVYSKVETEYIFHCEEDWIYYRSGFIEYSLEIMKNCPEITSCWLREDSDPGHPFSSEHYESGKVKYRLTLSKDENYHGFGLHPTLVRKSDYEKLQPYSQFTHEAYLAKKAFELGFKHAKCDGGYLRHIGYGRHVYDPFQK